MTDIRFIELTNFLMRLVVPNELDAEVYASMARMGVGPGLDYDPDGFDEAQRAAILEGIAAGHADIVDAANTATTSMPYCGDRALMGTRYLDLATGIQAGGIFPHTADQAYYAQWTKDAAGADLDGSVGKYTFTVPAGEMPPVRFFWSLTA